MDRPRLGGTPIRIRVSPTPGKYAYTVAVFHFVVKWISDFTVLVACMSHFLLAPLIQLCLTDSNFTHIPKALIKLQIYVQ